MTAKLISFKWDNSDKLSAWINSNGKPANTEICAFFVQRTDGKWVGGKFDWISNGNNNRPVHHMYPSSDLIYGNWGQLNWKDVPNPCNCAFVIVNGDKKRRSNVIASKWSR